MEGVTIERGERADYVALAPLHYRAGAPATMEVVLRARWRVVCAGVLVVSRPVLNARWRGLLWPGAFDTGDRRADAARLNEEMRCISRVIVDPRARGLGIGRALVRAYLDASLTRRTEAVAAMGAVCGIFRSAGMREVLLPRTKRDAALVLALRREGVRPWELVDGQRLLRARGSALEVALRRWANDSGSTRRGAGGSLELLVERAARAVASPIRSRAYGWDGERSGE